MQVDTQWKAAANLQLLLGERHPPVRIEHDPVAPPKPLALAGDGSVGGDEDAVAARAAEGTAMVDARNTANFRTTAYCSLQDPNAPAVRRRIVSYYQEMLRRIPMWRYSVAGAVDDGGAFKAEGAAASGDVKREGFEEEEGEGEDRGSTVVPSDAGQGSHAFRAVGILTQVHDPVGEQAVLPWEFYMIPSIDDESYFDGPVNALLKDVPQERFPLLFASVRSDPNGSAEGQNGHAASGPATAAAAAEMAGGRERDADEGQRLSLYARMLGPFTGLYPGMALGIVGDAFQRSARGVLTGVLLRDLVLPSRPVLPWRVDRPLRTIAGGGSARGGAPKATRVHFCSGPFPRRDVRALLRAVTRQALHRGADVLIIGGPLVKPFEDFEKEVLPSVGVPFSEMLDSFVDALEETIAEYYATRPSIPHMKVVLVSHPHDVTQAPVLPTTMYALADSADIFFRSNPCRVAINGVHFAVCNEDVVGHMRDVMVERWPTAEGSLRRVVEALVQSRMYTPLTELPATTMDMKHMANLRMDFMPSGNELLELERGSGTDAQRRRAAKLAEGNWNRMLHLCHSQELAAGGEGEHAKEEAEAGDQKRVKLEGGVAIPSSPSAQETTKVPRGWEEYLPHIMFLPSTRPQFAYVTHRGVPVARAGADAVEDESRLDDTATATGVMVVNQEVWSRRASPRFELRVAEVTMQDSDLVTRRGASAANGVACGVLHIFNADKK